MFYFMADFKVANYEDDSTPFSAKLDGKSVTEETEISSATLFSWLKNNYMKVNTDKSHLLSSGNNKLSANIDRKSVV